MSARELFETLVREHAEMLIAFLRATVRDAHLADDLFQETMLVAWRDLDKYDRDRPFGPWLRGIAINLVRSHWRRHTRGVLVGNQQFLEMLDRRFESLVSPPGDNLDEELDKLRDCLEALPEPYRQTVQLRYHENLTGESLASRLAVSFQNAKKRLQRARARLFDCMQQPATAGGGS